jgi:hypothetical protein
MGLRKIAVSHGQMLFYLSLAKSIRRKSVAVKS